MDISIVPEIINSEGIEFIDVNGFAVNICKKSNLMFNYSRFQRPFLVIDILEKRKYKDIVIKRIGIEQLENLGYRIVSVKSNSKIRNRPRQAKSYLIQQIGSPVPNAQILLHLPIDHSIEYDIVNNRIRLKGSNVWPYNSNENATPWINVEVQNG